jgi:aminoglycoside phosphotransferase family enzyme/gluconate kinase
MTAASNPLLAALLQPSFYDHPVSRVELVETHISRVFLTGPYAYKIKKPVNFGFLDFSTLQRRKVYCEEELRLNGRLAPDIYLSVIPITESNGTLQLNGKGHVIEYAIKMRQFDAHGLFSLLFDQGKISLHHMQDLARRLAEFHTHADQAGADTAFGSADEVIKPVEQNFAVIKPLLTSAEHLQQLEAIRHYSLALWQTLRSVFEQRKAQGHIRECHGDLHLGNIALSDHRIIIFDGIEFNDSFRWIDTFSDIAFLLMDLQDHHGDSHATHLLNQYLDVTGDYNGLNVLNFYKMYRAMVRAKVAALRLQQEIPDSAEYKQTQHQFQNYINLAVRYSANMPTSLTLMHGVSGSGKSWCADKISDVCNAIVLRSDRERKRLFAGKTDHLYSSDITRKTYQHLLTLTQNIIQSGFSVIVDATFLDAQWREKFRTLAEQLHTRFNILSCQAEPSVLEQRLLQRAQDAQNISDADISVMRQQLKNYQPLSANEQQYTTIIDAGRKIDIGQIAHAICPNKQK